MLSNDKEGRSAMSALRVLTRALATEMRFQEEEKGGTIRATLAAPVLNLAAIERGKEKATA